MANGDRSAHAVQPRRPDDDRAIGGHEALNRLVDAGVQIPIEKTTHWGKRKLKRDQ